MVHICDDLGKWAKEFVMALSKKWKEPQEAYLKWAQREDFGLGQIQKVQVESDIWVINLIGQSGIKSLNGIPPIRYWAIEEGHDRAYSEANNQGATIHMPKIGTGLAGGDWSTIERLIHKMEAKCAVDTYIYEFETTI